jgi:hypothetical protein
MILSVCKLFMIFTKNPNKKFLRFIFKKRLLTVSIFLKTTNFFTMIRFTFICCAISRNSMSYESGKCVFRSTVRKSRIKISLQPDEVIKIFKLFDDVISREDGTFQI